MTKNRDFLDVKMVAHGQFFINLKILITKNYGGDPAEKRNFQIGKMGVLWTNNFDG